MTKSQESSKLNLGTSKKPAHIMLRTLFSTTLRVFVPVTILFIIGLIIDLNAQTKPLGMAIGTTLGAISAIVLVVMQLKDIRRAPIEFSRIEGEE